MLKSRYCERPKHKVASASWRPRNINVYKNLTKLISQIISSFCELSSNLWFRDWDPILQSREAKIVKVYGQFLVLKIASNILSLVAFVLSMTIPHQNWGTENVGVTLLVSLVGKQQILWQQNTYFFTFQLQQLVSPQSTNKNLKHLKEEPPQVQRMQLASHYYSQRSLRSQRLF